MTQPLVISSPPPAGDLHRLMDSLPCGAFGRAVRAGMDPLWGLELEYPDLYAELEADLREIDAARPCDENVLDELRMFAPEFSSGIVLEAARRSFRTHSVEDGTGVAGRAFTSVSGFVADIPRQLAALEAEEDDEADEDAAEEDAELTTIEDEAGNKIAEPGVTITTKPPAKIEAQGPMHVIIDKTTLLSALRRAQSVVFPRSPNIIYTCVLIEAQPGGVFITGTGSELTVRAIAGADVTAPGRIAVPAARLVPAVSELPDGAQVELRVREEPATEAGQPPRLMMHVRAGRSRFVIPALDPTAFPAHPIVNGADLAFAAKDLATALDRIAYAAVEDNVHTQYNGAYLCADTRGLRLYATDGHRLARSNLPVRSGLQDLTRVAVDWQSPGVLIPHATLREARKLLDGAGNDDVHLTVATNGVVFAIGTVRLTSKLLDVSPIDYEGIIRLMAAAVTRTADVSAAELTAAVRRVRVVAEDKTRRVRVTLAPDMIRVAATGTEGADAVDEIEFPTGMRTAFDIGFQSAYMLDLFGSFSADALVLACSDAVSPTAWYAAVQDFAPADAIATADHLAILMPLRLDPPTPAAQVAQAAA